MVMISFFTLDFDHEYPQSIKSRLSLLNIYQLYIIGVSLHISIIYILLFVSHETIHFKVCAIYKLYYIIDNILLSYLSDTPVLRDLYLDISPFNYPESYTYSINSIHLTSSETSIAINFNQAPTVNTHSLNIKLVNTFLFSLIRIHVCTPLKTYITCLIIFVINYVIALYNSIFETCRITYIMGAYMHIIYISMLFFVTILLMLLHVTYMYLLKLNNYIRYISTCMLLAYNCNRVKMNWHINKHFQRKQYIQDNTFIRYTYILFIMYIIYLTYTLLCVRIIASCFTLMRLPSLYYHDIILLDISSYHSLCYDYG